MRQKMVLMRRLGYSVWLGPSQAPTTSHVAGVFLRGRAMPGQVVGLFPGAVYNSEMRQKAIDFGHFANPNVPRLILPRYDDCIIDVHGAKPDAFNPYAIAHHVRHPPAGITPNCMRLQCDFIDADNSTDTLHVCCAQWLNSAFLYRPVHAFGVSQAPASIHSKPVGLSHNWRAGCARRLGG